MRAEKELLEEDGILNPVNKKAGSMESRPDTVNVDGGNERPAPERGFSALFRRGKIIPLF